VCVGMVKQSSAWPHKDTGDGPSSGDGIKVA